MSDDREFTTLLQDLQFAIDLPPNRYLNTISRTYDKKTLYSPISRFWVQDGRDVALQFLQNLVKRCKEYLMKKEEAMIEAGLTENLTSVPENILSMSLDMSRGKKKLLRNKMNDLFKTAGYLYDFYGEDNPDVRSKLRTFQDELKLFINSSESDE